MPASDTPTKNDPKRGAAPVELTTAWATIYTAPAAERNARLLGLVASNFGNFGGLIDLAHVVGAGTPERKNLIAPSMSVPPGIPLRIPLEGIVLNASDTIQSRCINSKANPSTNVLLGTAEQTYTANDVTFTATLVTYGTALDAAIVSSPANADLVGRLIWVGANAALTPRTGTFGLITANDIVAKTITCGAGWKEYKGGLLVTAATPAANSDFIICASLRDTGETTLAANQFVNGTMTAGASGASTGRIIGNNAGIATYGTTYNIDVGGWAGGTPAVTNPYQIAPGISVTPHVLEMAA